MLFPFQGEEGEDLGRGDGEGDVQGGEADPGQVRSLEARHSSQALRAALPQVFKG